MIISSYDLENKIKVDKWCGFVFKVVLLKNELILL